MQREVSYILLRINNHRCWRIYVVNDGCIFAKKYSFFNNSHVVLENFSITQKHDYHINVEVGASVQEVKYIHNHIYKDMVEQ